MVEFIFFTVGPWILLLWVVLEIGGTWLKKLDNLEKREAALHRARREIEARSRRARQEEVRRQKYNAAIESEKDDEFLQRWRECADDL